MFLILLAFLGGILTIVSPCILPVIPFVFARADRPFLKSGLPLLLGMVLSFALLSTVASVGGNWIVQANHYGRSLALGFLAFFAITMIFPSFAEFLTRPFVRLGGSLAKRSNAGAGIGASLLLGVATGLLWAPCAGPILGLILTGAALGGDHLWAGLLLVAYALGAASALALVLCGGQRILARLKRSRKTEEGLRKGLGVAILLGVWLIAAGVDRNFLTNLSEGSTSGIEEGLITHIAPSHTPLHGIGPMVGASLGNEGRLPLLPSEDDWIDSPALTPESLKGKVTLIDFWTYSCINCIRTLPIIESWYNTYKDKGFLVIGVHTPEFAFERLRENVEMAVHQFKITYPVALDNDYHVWNAFHNEYWPAHFLIDATGNIRYHHFGEGDDMRTEAAIRALLMERGVYLGPIAKERIPSGIEASADEADDQSPETYVGKERGERFAGQVPLDQQSAASAKLQLNTWDIAGDWDRSVQYIRLLKPNGSISFRFHARDVHLVLGPSPNATAVYFHVLLDGKPIGVDHGADLDDQGQGVVNVQRLYQLVRQHGAITDHTVTIQFDQAGVDAFAFTFG